jgi:hypothetical protein
MLGIRHFDDKDWIISVFGSFPIAKFQTKKEIKLNSYLLIILMKYNCSSVDIYFLAKK